MPTQTLQLLPGADLELEIEVAEMMWDYGDGKIDQALVGNSAGQLGYRLTFNVPDRTSHQVTDAEDSVVKTYAKYLWDFWLRRKVDGAAFNLTDPRTGNTVTVVFAERRLSYKSMTRKAYTTGLLLKQYRTT